MTEEQTQEEAMLILWRAYATMASTDAGKLIIADLEHECGFLNCSVCESKPDALQTLFNEGKRRVYLRIHGMIKKGKENA